DASDPKQFLDNKIFKLLPQAEENIFPLVATVEDNKLIGSTSNDETKTSFSPSSVFELMYAFARQKRKLHTFSLFKP
ncbi:unnamed protein product, partial [Rotaria magnacalcarata]